MPKTNPLDFSTAQGAGQALRKLSQLMQRAGQPVVSSEFSEKPKRSAGVTYREAYLTLASGQQVTLRVNSTGDIYQVLLNGQVKPMKEHADTAKAVAELAAMAEKNQAAFQKAQARQTAEMPKGMVTPKPKLVDALKQQVSDLDAQLAERRDLIAKLQAQLGAGAMADSACLPLSSAYVAARELAKDHGAMLDNAAVVEAFSWLRGGLDVVEADGRVSLEQGDVVHARHQLRMAQSFQSALIMLDSASSLNDAALEQLVAIAKADAMDEDSITNQEALASLLAANLVDATDGMYFLTSKGKECLNDNGYDAYGEPFASED